MWEKFKSKTGLWLGDDMLYMILLLCVVAITAFGLGRLSERQRVVDSIDSHTQEGTVRVFEAANSGSEVATDRNEPSEVYVASKSGTKYHLPWCAGAQQIKEANKVYFETRTEAEAAGYTPAANCKGI